MVPLPDEDLLVKMGGVAPDALAEDKTSAEVPRGETPPGSPRETLPPGEEQPERRGEALAADIPREAPPPGEERAERRTP